MIGVLMEILFGSGDTNKKIFKSSNGINLDSEMRNIIELASTLDRESYLAIKVSVYAMAQYTKQSDEFHPILSDGYMDELDVDITTYNDLRGSNAYSWFIMSKNGVFHRTTYDKLKEVYEIYKA